MSESEELLLLHSQRTSITLKIAGFNLNLWPFFGFLSEVYGCKLFKITHNSMHWGCVKGEKDISALVRPCISHKEMLLLVLTAAQDVFYDEQHYTQEQSLTLRSYQSSGCVRVITLPLLPSCPPFRADH